MYIILLVITGIIVFAMDKQSEPQLHKIFVYGTLKKEQPNHYWFSKNKEGFFKFLYEAKTKNKYPLIIGTKYNIPFLLYSPGNGTFVEGEVYEVNDTVLKNLDILEEHPDYYIRELDEVVSLNNTNDTAQVWIYFIKDFKNELLNEPFYKNYDNNGTHGRKYVESENSTLNDLVGPTF